MTQTQTPEDLVTAHENAQARLTQVVQEYEARRASILAIVQGQLDALGAEYAILLEDAHREVSETDAAARAAVMAAARTVKGSELQAVYVKPSTRTTWDTARLEGYATVHPEILPWRKQTEVPARVDFKFVKGGK